MLERYGIAPDTIVSIGTFSVLWGRFEQVCFCNRAEERKVIAWASEYTLSYEQQTVYYKIREEAERYLSNIDLETIKQRIYSEQNPGKDHMHDIILGFLTDIDRICVAGCFLFIFRIRNNLFHGLKDIWSLDNQEKMIDGINQMLNSVLVDYGA